MAKAPRNPAPASAIEFEGSVEVVNERMIVRLPAESSSALPSRGQVAATVTINDETFATVVEPDGLRGHWLSLETAWSNASGLDDGSSVTITLVPTKVWPEPRIPADFQEALDHAPHLAEVWDGLTPMARWEWVRWIGATKNPDTRARRVDVSISKMETGKRRPCCFDLASCTDPELSKSGKLLGMS